MSELRNHTDVKIGSDRSFGLVFAGFFALVALLPLLKSGPVRWGPLAVAAAVLAISVAAPAVLHPLNRLWFRIGLLLGKIVSPIVMGLLFVVTVAPTGMIMRALGSDPLNRKFDPDADSYWIPVEPEKQPESSMRNQF